MLTEMKLSATIIIIIRMLRQITKPFFVNFRNKLKIVRKLISENMNYVNVCPHTYNKL